MKMAALPPWTVAYICRPLDPQNPNSATQVRWVRALAAEPRIKHLHVITPRVRTFELPPNVTVHDNPRGRGGRLLGTALPFYRAALSIHEPLDFYFIVQGGPYPAFLLPVRLATRTPVYQWKAHPAVSRRMRFYASYCDDLVFTATPSSLPLQIPNRRVVGHGIDLELFQPEMRTRDRHLLVLGRIAPIKRIELAIDIVAAAEREGHAWPLDVIGPTSRSARAYLTQLQDQVRQLGVSDLVTFKGATSHADVPHLLSRYRAMLSLSHTAFDKAVGEAMACGLPVLTTNPSVLEDLPPDLRGHAALPEETQAQVEQIARVLEVDDSERSEIGHRLRRHIKDHHSLRLFFTKILDEIEAHQNQRETIVA